MRDFLKFNDALLAKIGWRLINNPASLLGKILQGKYFPDGDFLTAGEASVMSHSWRGVLIGRDLLTKNIGWVIGNGHSISIWRDLWLNLSKQESPMGPPTEQSAGLMVSALVDANSGQWNIDLIQRLVPEYEEKILCLKPNVTGIPDKLIWLGTKSGDYTTKSGYFSTIDEDDGVAPTEVGFTWRKTVWNLDCAPKVKQFAWKVLKRALPVGERIIERHIDADPKCKRCGCSESITHLLFHCGFAQKVWLLAPLRTDMDFRGIIDLMAAWPSICNQTCLPPSGITSKALVPWIIWSLWKARNKFVFEGFSLSPEVTLSTAINLSREWSVNAKMELGRAPARWSQEISASSGATITRSDAAWVSSSNSTGLGWTLLTSPEIRSFQKRLDFVGSPLMAEGLALREATLTCRRLEMRSVRFESDSAHLIKCLKTEIEVAELHSIVSDILSIVAEFESVSFGWIPREKNMIADVLAKNAQLVFEPLVVEDGINAPN